MLYGLFFATVFAAFPIAFCLESAQCKPAEGPLKTRSVRGQRRRLQMVYFGSVAWDDS